MNALIAVAALLLVPVVGMAADTEQVERGRYLAIVGDCAACHTATGAGIPRLFPTLSGSAVVQSPDPVTLARVVLIGAQAVATAEAPTGPAMPAFGWKLSDAQTASVLTYIRNAWGNVAPAVDAGTVASTRRHLAQRAGN